jgi:twinkle protein
MREVQEYLEKKGFEWRRRGDNAVMNCPFCDPPDKEKKFAISLSSGAFNCLHLNRCGKKGSFRDFQTALGDRPLTRKDVPVFFGGRSKTYSLPDVKISEASDAVIEYLAGRGFTEKTINHFKVGSKGNAVMLPYYRAEKLINVKYRDITDKKTMWTEKNAEPILFNRDQIYEEPLIICEGEYDAMALYQYGIDAVSVPMGCGNFEWVENEWDYLETFSNIYICFDGDAPGRENARKLAQRLGEWRCKIISLPKKDANECLVSGVRELTIQSCIANAQELTPETLVSPSYFAEQVQNIFAAGSRLFGVETAWPKLNEILKGWRGGEVTIWSGRNGSGKSTILNQHFINIARRNVKTCIYSGEMPPERYLRWAIIQFSGNDKPSPVSVKNSLEWMDQRIFILNVSQGIQPEKLLSDFEYAARRYNVQHFIIDSLMKVSLNEREEYSQQKDFVSRLSDFAKKFNVHVHLVAHPRKTENDTDTPGKVDVKGSSHITDLADNVIVLYRPDEEAKEKLRSKGKKCSDMQLYVKKNREFGIEGKVHLWFDERLKTFRDVES